MTPIRLAIHVVLIAALVCCALAYLAACVLYALQPGAPRSHV